MRKLVIGLITTGVLLAMIGLRASDLRDSRAEILLAAEEQAANLSVILAAYLHESFAAGDAALRQLTLHSRRVGGPEASDRDWGPSLTSAQSGLSGFGAISITDRYGTIRHSTRAEIRGQARGGETIVREALSATDDELIIGAPRPTVRGGLIIPVGRRLLDADGSVIGAVVASYLPATPRGLIQSVDVGERGSVWVFHPEGLVLYREPSADDIMGAPAGDNPIFQAATRGSDRGTLHEALERGGPMFVNAFYVNATPPLIVAVSLNRDELLLDWRDEVASTIAVFGIIALMLASTLVVLFRQMGEKAAAERELVRTRELEEVRLREANDRLAAALASEQRARQDAESASTLKDQFLMTVSHELRTPLTAIYGWARMLNAGAVSERQKGTALRSIERNAYAQTRLIDDLLDVSRIMLGTLRLEVRPISLADVVESALETVRSAADAKAIRLDASIDPAADSINADAERLQQVIWNLLSNAVKFTPHGGQVRVTVTRVGVDVEIVVADTGVGISPEFLPIVFERFRQEESGSERRYGGLGLGLAIVRSLVELHGGSVTAQSDGRGHGAVFTIRLPSPVAQAGTPQALPARPARIQEPSKRLERIRVLVVDDDPEARALFATILEVAGASVTCASSADEAMALLRGASFDVMVSDIEMPEADGYRLVQEAHAITEERAEPLAAVAVTAYSRPEDEARSLAAGFHRHLQKPVEPAALVAAVLSAYTAPPELSETDAPSGM